MSGNKYLFCRLSKVGWHRSIRTDVAGFERCKAAKAGDKQIWFKPCMIMSGVALWVHSGEQGRGRRPSGMFEMIRGARCSRAPVTQQASVLYSTVLYCTASSVSAARNAFFSHTKKPSLDSQTASQPASQPANLPPYEPFLDFSVNPFIFLYRDPAASRAGWRTLDTYRAQVQTAREGKTLMHLHTM